MNTKILNKYSLEIGTFAFFKKSNVLRYNLPTMECMALEHAFQWGFTNAYSCNYHLIEQWNIFVSWNFPHVHCPSILSKGGKKKQYSDINCDSLILPTLRNFTKTESYSIHPFVLGFLAKQNVFLRLNRIVCISAFKIFSCHIILHCLNIGPYILDFLRDCLPSSYRPISFHSNSFTPL